jgi:phosphoribosylformylglycinamidine cyclo-ligase
MAKISYKDSGVNIDAGNRFVDLIKPIVKSTFTRNFDNQIGSFSGLFPLPAGFKKPYLASAADGIGTKLKVAFMTGRFDTIGIDLVAMNVNDLITCGAKPIFFLDYIATSSINPKQTAQIVKGIANGCIQSGCVLLGGETAEMPDIYRKNEFDLAGFVVGIVDKDKIIDGKNIRNGDIVVGLGSSGLHSNGYSLVRNLLLKKLKLDLDDRPKPLRRKLGNELLVPTKIYVNTILKLNEKFNLKAIAHITGGGLIDNIPRVLPKSLKVQLDAKSWNMSPIFKLIDDTGMVDKDEMYRTFNCGIGMILIISSSESAGVMNELNKLKERAFVIGEVVKKGKTDSQVEFVN